MRFHGERVPAQDLTFSDVFLVPNRSSVVSRLDVDLSTSDGTGTSIPVVAANMTAVSGRRMAETMARCGGLAVIPQDIPAEVVADVVAWTKQRHTVYDTPLTLPPGGTVGEALNLLPKRNHGAVIVVEDGRAVCGHETRQRAHERRLAGAVGADHRDHGARPGVEPHARPARDGQVDVQAGRHGVPSQRPRSRTSTATETTSITRLSARAASWSLWRVT